METINTPQPLAEPIAPASADVDVESREQSISPGRAALRRFLRDGRAVFCVGVILFIVIGSFLFPPIYQHLGPPIRGGVTGSERELPQVYHNPAHTDLSRPDGQPTIFPLGPNSLVAPLGTDTIGHDTLGQLMAGVNVSIVVALSVEVFDIGLGLLLGTLAGFFSGVLDTLLARFTDIMFAFPGLLLIILVGAALGPIFDQAFRPLDHVFPGTARILLLVAAIGFLAWPLMMRYVRGQTLQLKEQQYIEAARTVGTSSSRIITRHIIPNLLNIVIVAATLNILGTIVAEAGISLLGVGIQPPATSLGLMISDGLGNVYVSALEVIIPGVMLVILVVCFAFVGDGVNDAFNPRTKD